MARVLPLATNVSFQLVCRAWLHVIPVDLLFMPKPLAELFEELNGCSVLSVIWMKVRALQSVDEVEQVKVVVNDPVQVKVKEAMAWNDGMCKEGF